MVTENHSPSKICFCNLKLIVFVEFLFRFHNSRILEENGKLSTSVFVEVGYGVDY